MNQRFCNGMIHVIKQGENLYQLSRKYRVPLALILRANPYVDVYNLQPGQEICIPMSRPIMPFPGVRPPRPRTMMNDARREMEEEMREEMQEDRQEDMRDEIMSEPRMEPMRESDREGRQSEMAGEFAEMPMPMEQQEEVETDTYVTDGVTSLAAVVEDMGVSVEDLLENNRLEEIILAADVKLSVPKRV